MLSKIAFIMILWTTVGTDGEPGLVPPTYAAALYDAALHHGVDPVQAAAVLLAENRSRDYNPREVGRYGTGGEAGLGQLKSTWASRAHVRCNAQARTTKKRFAELGDCLFIPADARVWYKLREREADKLRFARGKERKVLTTKDARGAIAHMRAEGWILTGHRAGKLRKAPKKPGVDLFQPLVNLEATIIAMESIQRRKREIAPTLPDWYPLYRCQPSSYDKRREAMTPGCKRSVERVRAWEKRLRAQRTEVARVMGLEDRVEETAEL